MLAVLVSNCKIITIGQSTLFNTTLTTFLLTVLLESALMCYICIYIAKLITKLKEFCVGGSKGKSVLYFS